MTTKDLTKFCVRKKYRLWREQKIRPKEKLNGTKNIIMENIVAWFIKEIR
jgi:hypothetical protein